MENDDQFHQSHRGARVGISAGHRNTQRSYHPGHAARAQAVPADQAVPGEGGVSSARAKALQDCSSMSGGFSQHGWGTTQSQLYRSCMAKHGEAE